MHIIQGWWVKVCKVSGPLLRLECSLVCALCTSGGPQETILNHRQSKTSGQVLRVHQSETWNMPVSSKDCSEVVIELGQS